MNDENIEDFDSPGMFCLEKRSDRQYVLGNNWFVVKKGSILHLEGCIDGEDAGWIDVELDEDITCNFRGLTDPKDPSRRYPNVTPINLEAAMQSAFQDYLVAKKARIALDMKNCLRRREALETELQTLQIKIQNFQPELHTQER